MFENFKSGNIKSKLINLCKCTNELKSSKYNKDINKFIPNISKYIQTYHYTYWGYDENRDGYEFTINNITYGFEDNAFVYIKVKDIVIFHNREKGNFEGVYSGWNHKLPIEMIQQIKKDSKIINEYIKEIKDYIKHSNDTKAIVRHKEEQEELNKIFCKEGK